MEQDDTPKLTEFDTLIADHKMQLIKAAIPYIPDSEQRFISVYIKFNELMTTMRLFDSNKDALGICSVNENATTADMLNALKVHCNQSEKEMLEMIENFMQVSALYRQYAASSPDSGDGQNTASAGGAFSPMDLLKGMLTPEQQSTFDTYSTLFDTMK